jgi:hypothetical protein
VTSFKLLTPRKRIPPPRIEYALALFRTRRRFHRRQLVDRLTQDSYVNHDSSSFCGGDSSSFCGGEYDSNCDDDNSLPSSSQPFARSLLVPLSQRVGNSRDRLKPYLEELFSCLDRLDDATQIDKTSKLMEDEVARLRCIIAQSTKKRRRQVENVTSVNVVVETRSNNPKRIKGTRHIEHYRGSK